MSQLSKKTCNTIKRLAVVLGIIIIPLLYSYLYLGAFWNPYSRLDVLPIAIVNEDQGAVIRNRDRNVGEELITALQEDGSLKFIVTTQEDAKAGTQDSKYYAAMIIPSDFSLDIASAETTDKTTATILFAANEKKNYLASQIVKSAVTQVEENLRSKIDAEIVGGLADRLTAVPQSLTELSDGIGKLEDGSSTLAVGSKDLSGGAQELSDGALTVSDATAALAAGTENLSSGMQKLASGASALTAGTNDLTAGTQLFVVNMHSFLSGLQNAAAGSAKLTGGASSLDTGIDSLLSGVQELSASTQDIDKLSSSAVQLAEGAKTLNVSLTAYISGVDSLIAGVNSTSAFLTNYVTNINPSIMNDPYFAGFMAGMSDPAMNNNIAVLSAANVRMKAGSEQIAAGSAALASGSSGLSDIHTALTQIEAGLVQAKAGSASLSGGAADLNAGLTQLGTAAGQLDTASVSLASGASTISGAAATLFDGASKLSDGASSLSSGAQSLASGTGELSGGVQTLAEGAADLSTGAYDLEDGITTAKTGVDDSITTADEDLSKLDGLSDFANAPVTVENTPTNPVPNYGTAFAPYFLSLSLWVGALMIFLGTYMDNDDSFTILSRSSKRKYLRSFIYLGLGLVQALVLGKVLEIGLGLTVKSESLYYLACCLFSVTSVSIIQFFMVNCKAIGKFLCIILLILQLTSCGGTFPMETVPGMFNVLYPFMPMTYSVGLFKEAISGGDSTLIAGNAIILIAITAAFTVLSLVMTSRDSRKERSAAPKRQAV